MLVVAWDEMNEAIVKLEAQERLAAYTVAVVASPYTDENGLRARETVLDGWRNIVSAGREWLKGEFQGRTNGASHSGPRDDRFFPSVRAFGQKMREVLGAEMRD